MKKLSLAVGALTVLLGNCAIAAEVGVPPPIYPLYPPPLVRTYLYTWTGCYLGVNFGGKWVGTSGTVDIASATAFGLFVPAQSFAFNDHIGGSFIGGGQVGCNYQAGNFVFGIEGDGEAHHWSTSRIFDTAGDNFDISSRWQASLRGRIGYAWDRILLYATGGVSWTSVRFGTSFLALPVGAVLFPASSAVDTQTLTGGTLGGGVEHTFLNTSLSIAVEGRYTWYGSHAFNSGQVAVIGPPFIFTPVTSRVKVETAEALIKLNYKFGGPNVATY
jgi:outer membrane immunogenic protein